MAENGKLSELEFQRNMALTRCAEMAGVLEDWQRKATGLETELAAANKTIAELQRAPVPEDATDLPMRDAA